MKDTAPATVYPPMMPVGVDFRPARLVWKIRSLVYNYPGGQAGLCGIDLNIFEKDRIALVGHNGAGKTTLVHHLNGLFQPQSGTVLYKGFHLEGNHLGKARREVGVLFQDPDDQLFCSTLDEDVAFGPQNQGLGPDEVEYRVVTSLRKVGIEHLRYKPPHRLSYGQKKRAAFATILAMEPEVLILDEPTANLDPRQEANFTELLNEYHGTLICISHDLPFLYSLCARAVVLENGSIHHDFSMQELVTHKKYLREHGLDFTFRLSCCEGGNGGRHASIGSHYHVHDIPAVCERHPAAVKEKEGTGKQPLIALSGYNYRYPDGSRGIRGVDLSIAENESIAVIGENGAGKSTLVACIAGIRKGEGEYVFDGKAVSKKERKELWRHIGIVFQDPADQLFCPSCREEVAFGPRQFKLPRNEIRNRVEEALALVKLSGFEDRVPHKMSAGERKRLSIAAVLAMRPRVLILDEPTANLDPQSEQLLCEILRQLPLTKILISHDIDIISILSERTVVMHEGRIIRDYAASIFLRDEHLVSLNGLDYTLKNACCREIMQLQGAASHTKAVSPDSHPLS